jgi:DNA-binding transcriptional LysR family regulator
MAMFDWNDLRFFLAVARSGKLTTAAQRLGTDHATVSRRVASLEQKLHAELFTRSPRGYALTPAGARLLAHAETMESSAATIQNDIAGERFSVSGVVRIGAPEGFGAHFLAERLGQLCLRQPQLDLQLVAMPRMFSLTKREADIAIGLARPERGRLFSRKLTDYSLRLYASRTYVAAHGPITTRDHVARHPIVGYIPELIFAPELDYLSHFGDALAPRLSSTSLLAQLRAAETGAGLCILPDFIGSQSQHLVAVLAQEMRITRTFWIMAHMDAQDSARIRTVIDDIVEQVRLSRDLFLPEPGERADHGHIP